VSGESKSVTPEMFASWNETTLPTLLSNYGLKDIYNADEFGLFYQCLPDKSYQLKSEKCSGGKHSKIRITGLAAANAVGDKLPMFVIGKARNPRCFKNVKKLPCRYRAQKKSWMDSILFEEWVREINKMFQAEERNVLLIVDNCPAHPTIEGLSNLKLIFLPPNTTSVTQPMDQGVIRCLKAHYRKRLVKLILCNLDSNKPLPKISLITALQLLVSAWNEVSKATIVNCFRKSKISEKDQKNAVNDEDDPFKEMSEELQNLREKDSSLVPENLTAEDFASMDDVVVSTASHLTDNEILLEALQPDTNEEEDILDDDEELETPNKTDVEASLQILKNLSLFSEKRGNQMQDLISKFETLLLQEKLEKCKQAVIPDFFKK